MDDPRDSRQKKGFTRRGLLRGLATTAVAASAKATGLFAREAAKGKTAPGSTGALPVSVTVNGKRQTATLEPRVTLAEALRETWGLTGTKIGCDRGACGACTVLLDGVAVNACLTLVHDADGRSVTTVEGLGTPQALSPIQKAFIEADALQCGFCTPGLLVSCSSLLAKNPRPSLDEIRTAVSGNLCRCGTYVGVFKACQAAAGAGVARG